MFKFPFQAQGAVIGITGSIGAGKSLVSEFLTKNNYQVINFDDMSKEIREKPEVKKQLIREFGTDDPKAIRQQIGGNTHKSMKLSQLVAVPALLETFKRTNELFKQGVPMVFWEAALLVETGTFASMTGIILVTADEQARIERVKLRDHVDETYIKPLLSQQMSDEDKIKKIQLHPKHLILTNDQSVNDFQVQLLNLEPWLLQFKKP